MSDELTPHDITFNNFKYEYYCSRVRITTASQLSVDRSYKEENTSRREIAIIK